MYVLEAAIYLGEDYIPLFFHCASQYVLDDPEKVEKHSFFSACRLEDGTRQGISEDVIAFAVRH